MTSPATAEMEDQSLVKDEEDMDTSLQGAEDDDAYEDTGELEMPKQLAGAWLTRVPRLLYECWSEFDDEEPIQIGVVRQYEKGGKRQLVLDSHAERQRKVPKLYDLAMMGNQAPNTFVFTERDLPGYKSRRKGGVRQAHNADRRDFLSSNSQPGGGKSRRYHPNYRKPIPKQTTLTASISDEGSCIPVENKEYNVLMKEYMENEKNKDKKLTMLGGDPRQYTGLVLESSSAKALSEGGFDTFVRTGIGSKPKSSDQKSARMPSNELLDRLFDLFKEYKYYSWTGIKQRIHQPESYLREKLAMIAELVKSGSFAGNWKLKPEAEMNNIDTSIKDDIKEEKAPEDAKAASGTDDQDDEDDMVDVL